MNAKSLRISPAETPGKYLFQIDGLDISALMDKAEIVFLNRSDGEAVLQLEAPIDLPDDIQVALFIGERSNGNGKN